MDGYRRKGWTFDSVQKSPFYRKLISTIDSTPSISYKRADSRKNADFGRRNNKLENTGRERMMYARAFLS